MARRSEVYPCHMLVYLTLDDKKKLKRLVTATKKRTPPEERRTISGTEIVRRLIRQASVEGGKE
jgi:hypothetical protein